MLAEVHGGKIGQHNVQVSPLRKTVGTGYFHQAVDHSTGLGSFYCITEQPVLASHSKGTDGILSKVIRNLASGVKQVVLHVGLLFAGVLYSLFQISGQRLLFQLFQPAPKSPEHGFLHHKALFLSFFGRQFCQFLFSCKQLVMTDVVVVNKDFLDDMDEETRATFRRLMKESMEVEFEAWDQNIEDAKAVLEQHGVTFVESDIAAFRERCMPLLESIANRSEMTRSVYDQVMAIKEREA